MPSRVEIVFIKDNFPAWRTQMAVADQFARRMSMAELDAVADAVAQIVVTIAGRPPAPIADAEKGVSKPVDKQYNAGKKKH